MKFMSTCQVVMSLKRLNEYAFDATLQPVRQHIRRFHAVLLRTCTYQQQRFKPGGLNTSTPVGYPSKLKLLARYRSKFRAQKSTPEGAFCGRSCLAGCISGGYPAEGGAAAELSLTARLDGSGFGLAPVVLPEHCRPGR